MGVSPAKPKAPKPAKPPKAWARESPGRYLSADGRFAIEQGGGRWFVVDNEQQDELGLARTLGPLDTLDEAKARADEVRSGPVEASPLQGRLAGGPAGRRQKLTVVRGGAADRADSDDDAPAPAKAPPPPKQTWLDKLPDREGRRARSRIAALESMGAPAAEAIVKRDIDGNVPAASTFVLGRAIRRGALDPWARDEAFRGADRATARVLAKLRKAGASEEDLRDIADFIARRTIERTLEVISSRERDPDAPAGLPGWRLIEQDADRPESQRRLFLDAGDLGDDEPGEG